MKRATSMWVIKRRWPATTAWAACALMILLVALGAGEAVETTRVDLELRTGGRISGLVVEESADGLVIVHDRTPYVFAWRAMKPESALKAKKQLLTMKHGDSPDLSPDDYFALGALALKLDLKVAAVNLLRRARQGDPGLAGQADELLAAYRKREGAGEQNDAPFAAHELPRPDATAPQAKADGLGDELPPTQTTPEIRAQVDAIYRRFGDKVREVLGDDIKLVETKHFLIWTDWRSQYHARLAAWSEGMYRAMCEQFDLDPRDNVFLAKCPIFCWRSKERFEKFARDFDGYDGTNAAGYTRSIEREGHVHIVLLRWGHTDIDFDRFAATLVHEGTHAFVHRLYSPRLIPHWINEGLAELMSERVLGDRSDAGEEAAMLARAYVRNDWPLGDLLTSTGPIRVEQYGLACSVVTYLEHLGTKRFAGLIRSLKEGKPLAEALAANYDGLTAERLEADWRAWIRKTDPVLNPPDTEDSRIPWRRHGSEN